MRVALLAGGVGGARFARGLVEVADELTIVGNVGDDVEILGLHVSPDLDTLLYTLAGLSDEERGWGAQTRPGTRSEPRRSSVRSPGSSSATETSASILSARRRSRRVSRCRR